MNIMKKTLTVTSIIQGVYCLLMLISMVLLGVYHFRYGEPYAEICFRIGALLFAGSVFGILIPMACEVTNTVMFLVRLSRMTRRQIVTVACIILAWGILAVLLLLASIVVFVSTTGGV